MAFPHHCQYHKAVQHKGLASFCTSIARVREASTNYRVFEQYKKGVFGVHKGVVFRTVLKRTWAGFWTSWRVVFGVHKKGLFSDTLEGGIV